MADYTSAVVARLEKMAFHPIQQWTERGTISVSENGKTYRVAFNGENESAVFQIDNEIIRRGQKCDKLLAVLFPSHAFPEKGTTVFIELKGKDISHAIDQLEAAIRNPLFMPYPKPGDHVRARIITAGCGPKSASRLKLEDARIRFNKLYNIELRVLKNSQQDTPI